MIAKAARRARIAQALGLFMLVVVAGGGCAAEVSELRPSGDPNRSPTYVMGAPIDAGGVTIRIQAVSDAPEPGSAASDKSDLFAVFATIHVNGQGDWITSDRFSLRTVNGTFEAITDLVAGNIGPLGGQRSGTTLSGWIGFSITAPVRDPVFIFRSKSGDEYYFDLDLAISAPPTKAKIPTGKPRGSPSKGTSASIR